MTWVRIDDRFRSHPKMIRVGPLGRDLWACGLAYCNENLTDGFIADDMVCHLAPGQSRPSKVVALLLDAGLWTRGEDGYHVHDYLKYQASATQVRADREAAKARKERWKEQRRNGVPHTVPNGDGTVAEQAPHPIPSHPIPEIRTTTALSGNGCPTAHRANPYRDPAREVLLWLNEKAGKNFELIDANIKLVEARLREGRQPWQLKKLVTVKCKAWNADPKMREYLRPETLFGKTKCAQYIGELPPPEPEEDNA